MTTFSTKTRLMLTAAAFVLLFAAFLMGQGAASAAPKTVQLTSLKTSCLRNGIAVMWTTDMERFTRGYFIYRSTSKSAIGERIVDGMIPTNGGNGGGSYEHRDSRVETAVTYFYTIEEVALNGNTVLHGPVSGNWNCVADMLTR